MTALQSRVTNPLQKASLIAGISLLLGILFDYLFFEKVPGISFPLYIIVIIAGLLTLSVTFGRRIDKQTFLLLIPLLFFSTMVFVRASMLLTFLNIVACFLLLMFIADTVFGKKIRNFMMWDYLKILFVPFQFIVPFLHTISDLFQLRGVKRDPKVMTQFIRGIIVAVPVLFIFILLFSSADLIFQKYLFQLWDINIDEETVARAVLVLLFTLLFIGIYSYTFRAAERADAAEEKKQSFHLSSIETSIVFGSVNALFLIFILLQITYLFGGESNITLRESLDGIVTFSEGFTYADYARKGFFELIAVSVISLLLLLAAEKFSPRTAMKHSALFRTLGTALVVQVLVIMVSAFTRLKLYEDAYGFTTLRLYSHAFIFLLAVIFLLLLYKMYIDHREQRFTLCSFVAVLLFLGGMNVLNPDAFIARKNIENFAVTGKLDEYYLAGLSTDAIPETIQVLTMNKTDEGSRKYFVSDLYFWSAPSAWQSWNLSRKKAENILQIHRRKGSLMLIR